jgi:hypothetical protein
MMIPPHSSSELGLILRRELLPGEHLLWSASSALRKLRAVFLIWLIGIPWTAFSLFWDGVALLPWMASS